MSHLDLMHTWERLIRRSQLPLAFSQGFNPHPKMNFASACALGTTSDGEYMDMELTKDMSLEEVKQALDRAMPPAFEVTQLKVVKGKVPSLMSIMERAAYQIRIEFVEDVSQEQLDAAIEDFFKRDEVVVYRYKKNSKDKKPVNIRPGVFEINMEAEGKFAVMHILVQTGNDFNVRPEEVTYGLMSAGMPAVLNVVRIHRKGLYLLDKQGALITPLDIV